MEDKTMWSNLVKLAMAVTFLGLSACASSPRMKPQELSNEIPQSAFNEDNWDTYRSDRNYQTYDRESFKRRVKSAKRSAKSSVAGR